MTFKWIYTNTKGKIGKTTTSHSSKKRITFQASTYQLRKNFKTDSNHHSSIYATTDHVSSCTPAIQARGSHLATPWQGQLNNDSAASALSLIIPITRAVHFFFFKSCLECAAKAQVYSTQVQMYSTQVQMFQCLTKQWFFLTKAQTIENSQQ